MPSRGYLKAAEAWEEERQMNELNASLDRDAQRQEIALEIARDSYGSDDVEVGPPVYSDTGSPDEKVESVDGGYWVSARVFIYADDVEERMEDG